MNNDLWNAFLNSGSVFDYLKYRELTELDNEDGINGDNNQGISNQRTDDWGE